MPQMGITVITRVAADNRRYRNCTRRSPKPQSLGLLQLEFSPRSLQSVCSPHRCRMDLRSGLLQGGLHMTLIPAETAACFAPCRAIPGKQQQFPGSSAAPEHPDSKEKISKARQEQWNIRGVSVFLKRGDA